MPVLTFQRAVYTALFLLLLVLPVYGECADISSPRIIINLPSRTLDLYSVNDFIKEYPIAIGKPSTPTPIGNFSIINKEVDPVWMPPRKGYVIPPGPDNPLGHRWMGFLPLYGIHGTNAPWAIGLAVSNGCVRMYEEDAQELFNIVDYGTPVKVTYDRAMVRIDRSGQVSVGIYPDIYGYGEVTAAEIYGKLEDCGLAGFVSETFIDDLIEQEADQQIPVARIVKLKVNNKYLNEFAVQSGNQLYVPVWAVAGALNQNIIWDEEVNIVRYKNRDVQSVVKGDVLYVSANDLHVLFGGQQLINSDDNCLAINMLEVFVNNKLITCEVQVLDGVLALPAVQLGQALGQKTVWNADKKLLLMKNRSLPYGLIDSQPYIKITQINEYYNAFVYWNQQECKIEITYPFKQ
ncbi:MAG: L,D-transpeptidase family protein [Veillonellaceae bacterium]|jgi:L,D-transpeptidase ErfK/SrfK|nr:L,D-transpeptidase family protein [Veillonellaceae bacterium]